MFIIYIIKNKNKLINYIYKKNFLSNSNFKYKINFKIQIKLILIYIDFF